MSDLKFDPKTHTYYNDGQAVISVTQVLKPISKKIYENIPKHRLDVAAKRGTAIHYAIELYSEFGVKDIDKEFEGYLDGYIKFAKDFNHKALKNEYMVYSKLGYAGTLDNLGEVNNELCLVDYKNVAKVHSGLVGLQLSAYRQGLKEEGIEVNKAGCLQLKPNGKHKFIIYTKEQLDEYFEHFKMLLNTRKLIKFYSN
jgi:hypothetical protein